MYSPLILAVLSGKELFNYNSSLFVDDDAAIDQDEEDKLALENKKSEEEEEAKEKLDQERAQAEQLRLAEIQRLEIEERIYRYEAKRQRAETRAFTFLLGDIVVNEAVFDEEEIEDLTPFPELVEAVETVEMSCEEVEDSG